MKTTDVMLVWVIVAAVLLLAWLYILLVQYALPLLRRPRQWDFHDIHLPRDE